MTVEDITDDFDTARDPSVPALLWEVRRERRVELMGEGFRLDDLRRWKKGDYVNKRPLGVYVTGASAKNLKVTGGPSNDEGYVYFFDAPLGWQEHYYLYPLPLKQLALNTNLEQNPIMVGHASIPRSSNFPLVSRITFFPASFAILIRCW